MIKIQKENNCLVLTIDRPQALNALNKNIFTELNSAFVDRPDITEIRGIIITGSGQKAFAAGADIKEFAKLNQKSAKKLSKRGQMIFNKIENYPIPVIAAVNGFALGGGCELAMACHMRVASTNAKFGQPEAKLGITPGYGGTQRFTRYIGKGKALELMLTCDMINADEALKLGLVNQVVEPEKLLDYCTDLVHKISRQAPLAVAEIIKCANDYFSKSKNGFKSELRAFGRLSQTKDFKEGSTAFVEKRHANFIGK